MALQPSKLSDFRIVAPLGSGATARVFEAVHVASNREVAIKMLDPREEEAVGELRERFAREALALSNLSSRHIARIVGFGFELGQPFLVLERLHGETIDARIKREGPIPPALLGPWVAQLLVGVRDCHANDVIHRDLKPANIFLQATAGEPVVKIIDFGVARLSSMNGGPSLTSTQHLLGSVGYMSPEQFESGKAVGPLTDLYAVGVVVFRCITGKLPFSGGSLDRVIQNKLRNEPALVSSIPGAPVFGALDWFAAKAMSREGASRFQTAREMLDAWHDIMPLLSTATAPRSLQVVVGRTMRSEPPVMAAPPISAPRTPPMARQTQHVPPPSLAAITSEISALQVASSEIYIDDEGVPSLLAPDPDSASTSENVSLAGSYDLPGDDPVADDAPLTRIELAPVSEVFGVYSIHAPHVDRASSSKARTREDEATRHYPHLRALVDKELELSRAPDAPPSGRTLIHDSLAATGEQPPRSLEGPPTTQHTGPLSPPEVPDEPPDSER